MIAHLIFGLIVGLVARFLMHGHTGLIMTALLGMAGGWVGGQLGRWLGWYPDGHAAGFAMSVLGASIVYFVFRLL